MRLLYNHLDILDELFHINWWFLKIQQNVPNLGKFNRCNKYSKAFLIGDGTVIVKFYNKFLFIMLNDGQIWVFENIR